ncbi:magnesium chelatase subunit D [Methylopila turkensis]|uniref:Mg-protoporphyrin IX chelatase n=1 Tax=Methylopila turkensis TaxID=1437816 RepID=A0A9W6N4L9_9HYPH|nr:Mg-protoporphyrin IX chelatase [Methylopila turkensis]
MGCESETAGPTFARQSSANPPTTVWTGAVAAVALLAIDPPGLGGLRVRGAAGPARDRLLSIFRTLLPDGAPFRKLPLGVSDGRLLGGLDLAATLASGRSVLERGLLAETDGGALVIPSAERIDAGLAGRLAGAIDNGVLALQRDGFASHLPARFSIFACDEALQDEQPPPAVLTERLGLVISLSGVGRHDLEVAAPRPDEIAAARAQLSSVALDDEALAALGQAAIELGVVGVRPLMFAAAAARASAALAGRKKVSAEDLALAGRLVLGPRATQAPARAQDREPEHDADQEEGPPPADGQSHDEAAEQDGNRREMAETVLQAAAAVLPRGLLDAAGAPPPMSKARSAPGRAGAAHGSKQRGRPIGSRPGAPDNGARLDLIDTLRAAAPWQGIRRRAAPTVATSPRVLVRREDFRIKRLKEKRRTVTIFAVDASGSAALHRLAEAKGAVELLLAQSYIRRDEVALVAFRGSGAEIVLPPTRSLARARRALTGLPGGGGTPLASGLDAAAALVGHACRRGDQPTLVVLTDGAANVARDGAGGRKRAQDDATAAARALGALGARAVLIDVSPRPQERARDLAEAMSARYVALPSADAAQMARAIGAGR